MLLCLYTQRHTHTPTDSHTDTVQQQQLQQQLPISASYREVETFPATGRGLTSQPYDHVASIKPKTHTLPLYLPFFKEFHGLQFSCFCY